MIFLTTRVVLVNGARQAGKSTLTRLAAGHRPGTVIRLLDDPATLRAAEDDPTGFVEHDGLMVIDEVQLVPELLRPIKVRVDLDPTPGRYLLTGSSRILALRTLPDALPGRMEVIELWPFSPRLPGSHRRRRLSRGGAPGAAAPDRVLRFLPVHADRTRRPGTVEYRAARGFAQTARPARRTHRQSARPGHARQPVRHSADHARALPGAAVLGVPHQEHSGVVVRVDAARRGRTHDGELRRHGARPAADLVRRASPDGRVIGVKAGATVRTEDLSGLRNLANLLGDRFVAGFVLYTGQQTLPFGEKIRALPVNALWCLQP